MSFLIILPPLLQMVLWMAAIRPYCLRNGYGHTTGANWGISIWVDWQQAGETAKAKDDRGMILVCRAFLVLQILFLVGIGGLLIPAK